MTLQFVSFACGPETVRHTSFYNHSHVIVYNCILWFIADTIRMKNILSLRLQWNRYPLNMTFGWKKKTIWLFLIPVTYCYNRVLHHRDLDIVQTRYMSGSAEMYISVKQLKVVTKYLNFLDTHYWNWSRHMYFKVVLFSITVILYTYDLRVECISTKPCI